MTDIERMQRFIRALKRMTPREIEMLGQAMDDFENKRCSFEEAIAKAKAELSALRQVQS